MELSPLARARAAADHLSRRAAAPRLAVVLGSGLGAFADDLAEPVTFPYGEIPGFTVPGVSGHAGRLVVGRLPDGTRVAVLAGRLHAYEGHPLDEVVHPVRTLKMWGCEAVVVTNAAGGLNASFAVGDLMRITDHLNLTGQNPLVGPHEPGLGPRFPDMTAAYDVALGALVDEEAAASGLTLRRGVYAGLMGPSYETPAEIRMLAGWGADAVGMSTVNEVIAARHAGLRVAGVSCITNLAAGLGHAVLDHAEVEQVASRSRDTFIRLVSGALSRMERALATPGAGG